MEKFNIYGVFQNNEYLMNVIVDVIDAEDQENAMDIVCEMNLGTVIFDANQNAFFHIHNGETKILNDDKIIHCEVCDPRKKIVEIPILKIPIYSSKDYEEITLNQLVRGILKEVFEKDKEFISFESIAFGVNT
ncbi:hypothetical protein [Paenibacillus macquariensis]|uniref:Immunity protein 10 n=1 Tax=Paenibacillus macquariensis TaxID=948756 RepID=A0ABY1KF75_9BACL|nr:hypothetical protein [Paenibacillus macquariensis]OAB35441.1 hypothetical protein PMSM_09295 [Paenibacillus macquariensis subsp. macquariensis]SIR74594.1 hypothetical protein SAMN05421578_16110 [Paenibacillus macquariensis]